MLVALILPTAAFGADCTAIKADKQRLACYDGESKESKNVPSTQKQPATAKNGSFKAGAWAVDVGVNSMNDKKTCTAIPKGNWKIQGTDKTLYVNMKGRGGVKYYKVRIDDNPASALQMATEGERDLSALNLGYYFEDIYNGKRLRLQIGTVLGDLVAEDIDLTGFKESVDFIRENCPG